MSTKSIKNEIKREAKKAFIKINKRFWELIYLLFISAFIFASYYIIEGKLLHYKFQRIMVVIMDSLLLLNIWLDIIKEIYSKIFNSIKKKSPKS